MLHSKQPPVARKFSGGVHFALGVGRNLDITSTLFDRGGRVLAQLDAICHGARAWMTHQPQVRGWWCITKKSRNKKFKRFLKEMWGWVDRWMH